MFVVALPIMFQNLVTNLVSLLDNFMVGRLGTEQTSGVAIANQILFIFNLTLFGAMSGPGVFTAQYHGKKDNEGIRYTVRFKAIAGMILFAFSLVIFTFGRGWLIDRFIHAGDIECDLELVKMFAEEYFLIMMTGLLPFIITQIFASTMRETGDTFMPMVASFVAVGTNCVLNYILIFGKLGVPEEITGVRGAAIATVTARVVECVIVVVSMYRRKARFPYLKGTFKSLRIPKKVASLVAKKSAPLICNELCWSVGMTLLGVCYSYYGGSVVAGYSISSTVWNLFTISFMSFGTAIGIIAGNFLGAREFDKAADAARKMTAFSLVLSFLVSFLLFFIGSRVPLLYEVTESAKSYASNFIRIDSFFLPVFAIVHASYFTVRSGGKTLITLLFDSFFTLGFAAPVAFAVYFIFRPQILVLYAIVQSLDIIKCVFGLILVKKKIWIRDIV